MPVLHGIRIPPVRVESRRVIPQSRVIVDVVQGWDDDCALGDFVATREDQVELGSAAGLEGGVVAALGLLDVFVEEGEAVGDVCCYGGGVIDVVVDEFLEETLLHAGVCAEAVN